MIFLIIGLIISFLLNIFFVWYIVNLLKKLLFVSDNMGDLVESLINFSNHINDINQREMYYGDEVLIHLLEHSRSVVEEVDSFNKIYELTNEFEDEQDEDKEHEKVEN